jgi:hypothetical protein
MKHRPPAFSNVIPAQAGIQSTSKAAIVLDGVALAGYI